MPLPLPNVTAVDLAFPAAPVHWIPDTIVPREAWSDTAKMPKDVPSNPEAAPRYAYYEDIFKRLFYRHEDATTLRLIPKAVGEGQRTWDALVCVMGCYGFSSEHKHAAWAFAADEWCEGIWFEKDGPPPWIQFEKYVPTNRQAASLLEKGLISEETARAINVECGDGDIGLFLGQLLATGRITAEVVQTHISQGAPDGR